MSNTIYKVGDRVAINNEFNDRDGEIFVVVSESYKTVFEGDQWATKIDIHGDHQSYMNHSLVLVSRKEDIDKLQPFNLNDKQLAVLSAATELREAQIKFTKALDALNNNQ